MYKIIGSDGKEYGPVAADQLHQWIKDGRVNAQTSAQAVESDAWKPLKDFPEFAASVGTSAPGVPPAPPSSQATSGQKSKVVAGLLGIFLGGFGIHRFYLGYTNMGIIQIVVTLVTCGFGGIWGFIEGILILCGSTITTDANGSPLKE